MSDCEKFLADELAMLRDDLRQSGLDSFQCAELLTGFLAVHGYGVPQHAARGAAARMQQVGLTLPRLQEELENLAWVM